MTISNKNPRDIYASLEAIWISKPTYLLKRLQLEQVALEQFTEKELVMTHGFMAYEIARLSRRLRDLKAIDTITLQVIDSLQEQAECEKTNQFDKT